MSELGLDATHSPASKREATTILKRAARSLVPSRADFCFIHLAEGQQLRCAASVHATRAGQRVVTELGRCHRILRTDPVSTVAHVVRTGGPQLRSEIAIDADPRLPPRVADAHRQLAPRSAIVVPLVSRGRVIGALTLGCSTSGRRYTSADVSAAKRFAQQLTSSLATWIPRRNGQAAHTSAPGPTRRPLPLRARA